MNRDFDKQALDRYITGNYGEDQFRDDEDPELEKYYSDYTDDPRHDYTNASDSQLRAWIRQNRRQREPYECEFGHVACGCTNSANMDGRAACAETVRSEMRYRSRMFGTKFKAIEVEA